jgi:hypothetical protein
VWSWDDDRTGWQGLLGDAAGGPDTPAYAAPARVADLAGLPPAYIEVGQLDIFRDEDLIYALRLGQAGVRSSSTSYPGVPELDFIAFNSAAARRVIADRIRALASCNPRRMSTGQRGQIVLLSWGYVEPEVGFEPTTFRLRVGPYPSAWTRPGPSWLLRCAGDSIQCRSVGSGISAWVAREVATVLRCPSELALTRHV